MFAEIPKKHFAELEEEVLAVWNREGIFKKSLARREGATPFTTYDGPPFATGLPHYGHLLAGTIKDVVLRFKTMEGFNVPRRFGWDCHGLPIEGLIEKKLGLNGAFEIEEHGIDKFNEACRDSVLTYTEEWKKTVHRMGRWVDFDETYRTMDATFMESVWWVFKQLFEKGLVYEGYRVMPVSAQLGTPLSNFEAGENYQEVDDPSITVLFHLEDDPETALAVWTTTPWTLPSNLGTMVGPEISYVKVRDHKRNLNVILAENRLKSYYKSEEEFEVVDTFLGRRLEGLHYKPLFPYFADQRQKGAFRILLDDNVSIEEGTGVVHTAPGFGEVDFYVCQKAGIDVVCPVTNNGIFTAEVPDLEGQYFKDADKGIIARLKKEGKLLHQGTIHHRYPMCPRTDTPLIYKVVSTWFVKVEPSREKLLEANESIHWTPSHLKHGRFGKWLQQARDWNIARNRYWGNPIPLWRSEDGDLLAVGSIKELEKLTGAKIDDIHRHYIDELTIEKNGKTYRRIPEVFDCWFESGSMPYAQNHYPFETKNLTLPADFIAEGLDQTRCWFYVLTVLSTLLFDKPAFKNVIVNGIILAENGQKMSKRLKNYPEPSLVIDKYGADAIRLYLLHSPAVKADDLRFSEHGVELVMRQILLPMWHAFTFLITYARIAKWKAPKERRHPDDPIDRWVISITQKLIQEVKEGMDGYELSKAVEPFVGTIDQLTNWYIRLNRRRFWEEDSTAFETLYWILLDLVKIAAPFVPFISDAIYRHLTSEESVHLCDYPTYDLSLRDEKLEQEMEAVQQAVSLGHQLRKGHKIKVRQPLQVAHIATGDRELLEALSRQKHLIAAELNVKEVDLSDDEGAFVELSAKPNFRLLGKKVGKMMRPVQEAIRAFDQFQLETLRRGEDLTITVEGEAITLTSHDVEVDRKVREGMEAANQGAITVVLDTTLSEELKIEGLAREFVNKVSTMRKEANLDYTDRIALSLATSDRVRQAVETHHDYITGEVLATSIAFNAKDGISWDLNGEECIVSLSSIKQGS